MSDPGLVMVAETEHSVGRATQLLVGPFLRIKRVTMRLNSTTLLLGQRIQALLRESTMGALSNNLWHDCCCEQGLAVGGTRVSSVPAICVLQFAGV